MFIGGLFGCVIYLLIGLIVSIRFELFVAYCLISVVLVCSVFVLFVVFVRLLCFFDCVE